MAESTKGESARCEVAREKIEALREDVREINQRLDKFASGMLEKMKGDTQLAVRVEQSRELVQFLDEVLVRGTSGSSSIKAEVENLRREVNHLTACCQKAEVSIAEVKRDGAVVEVAKITAQSSDWKTTAVLLGTFLTALAGLLIALLK